MKCVSAKFLTMRKADECVVYPADNSGKITVQGDRLIGQFDAKTGEGVLNYKGSGPKYFPHLSAFCGAMPFTFPREFVEACLDAQPISGDQVGPGVFVA